MYKKIEQPDRITRSQLYRVIDVAVCILNRYEGNIKRAIADMTIFMTSTYGHAYQRAQKCASLIMEKVAKASLPETSQMFFREDAA